MNAEILMRAGAILLPKAKLPKDILSDEVVARQWNHPALADPIVRIQTQNMLRGVDLEMGLLGFGEPDDKGIIGKKRREKLGFPGWALVNDPDHARFALDVVKDLKKATRKIKSKPGTAKDLIDEIGQRLATSVPHFLPSFYEEAARSFIAFENYSYASQYFEKARDAERVYALDVDPEMREQTFVDFALARALSIKSLTNFGLEMIEKGKAKEGFQSYFRIAVRRTRGGLPPSPAMAKDLKRLAKAAELDPAEEERNFLRELLGAAALRMAPAGFWKAYNKSLKTLAKEDPVARSAMLDLFPNMHPREWFEILDTCDACRALFDDTVQKEARSKHATADWFGLVLKQQNKSGWRGSKDVAERILTLLVECRTRLKEDGIKIPIPEGWYGVNPDVIETGLSIGAVFSIPENLHMLTLSDISDYKGDPTKCLDWEFISKDETFRALAVHAIGNGSGAMHSWIDLLPTRPFIRDVVDEWLTLAVERISTKGGIIDSYETVSRFANYPTQLWSFYPEQAEKLMATDIALPLQKTLQIGIWDEYEWPVFEKAISKFPNKIEVRFSNNAPYLILFDKVTARVIGGEGIVLEVEIPTHVGAEIESMVYTKDTLLLIYKKGWQEHGQWLGTPELFSIDNRLEYRSDCLRLPDGRAMFDGYRIITPGDQSFPTDYEKSKKVYSDDNNFWFFDKVYTSLDPISGKSIDGPKPPFLIEDSGYSGWIKHIPNASEKSLLGNKDNLIGMRCRLEDEENHIFLHEDIAGNQYIGTQSLTHLLKFAGDEVPRLFCTKWRGWELGSAEGVISVTSNERFRKGGFPLIAADFFAYFVPRDESASKAFRHISLGKCTEFITDAAEGEEKLLEKLVSSFTELKNENLRAGLAGMILLAAEQRKKLDELQKVVAQSEREVVLPYEKDPENMGKVFEGLVSVGHQPHVFLAQIKEVSAYFTRENPQENDGFFTRMGSGMWEDAIGFLGAFAFRAVLPDSIAENAETSLSERETLKAFLYTVADSPFVGEDLSKYVRYFSAERPKDADGNYLPLDWRHIHPDAQSSSFDAGVALTTYQGNEMFSWATYSCYVGFEFARSGVFSDIGGSTVIEFESGWGTKGELDRLFELFEEKGPLPIADAIPRFMELTGLTEPEASLAISDWKSPRLSKMKASTRDWARDVFRMQPRTPKSFFSSIVSDGPLEDLWVSTKLADRVAKSWLGSKSKNEPLDVEFVEAFKKGFKNTSTHVLRDISNIAISKTFLQKPQGVWNNGYCLSGGVSLEAYIQVLTFAMHNARVGSQVYNNIGSVFELIRPKIDNPNYLILIASRWGDEDSLEEFFKMFKGKPKVESGNSETVIGSKGMFSSRSNWRANFWANWDVIKGGHPVFEKLKLDGVYTNVSEMEFVFSSAVDALIERTKNTCVPFGEFETNPIFSVPKIVNALGEKYKISDDASALYLQIAALPFPSDANIRFWNGWKKKQHDTAIAELIDKDLVVSAKRSRASRTIFLHGHWEPKIWTKPIESWKFKHLRWLDKDGQYYRNRPFSNDILFAPSTLFERVWERIQSGDAPAFEDVK